MINDIKKTSAAIEGLAYREGESSKKYGALAALSSKLLNNATAFDSQINVDALVKTPEVARLAGTQGAAIDKVNPNAQIDAVRPVTGQPTVRGQKPRGLNL